MITQSQTSESFQLQAPTRGGFQRWRERYLGIYLSIAPFFLIFLVFGLFPIGFAFFLAFQSWDGIGPMRYVGLDQFRYLITDTFFIKSIWVTLQIWIISTTRCCCWRLGWHFC